MSDSVRDVIDALLEPSDLPHRLPRFADISIEDYGPAIEQGMAEQLAALAAITTSAEEPTFENTLVALERSGERLDRVLRIFFSLLSADSDDDLDELHAAYAPRLAALPGCRWTRSIRSWGTWPLPPARQ